MEVPDGFAVAYPTLQAAALSQARHVLRCTADEEEVVQEALLRAYASWEDIEPFAPQWVARVALNLALSRLRRRHRQWPAALAELGETGVDTRIDLSRALERLPVRQRQVVVLRYLADLSERDVAGLLEISPGAVKRHLHRALATLRSPASALAAGYAMPTRRRAATTFSWRTMFDPAVEPAEGWPARPWDHRHIDDDDGVVRVAVDQSGAVVLDADGDEVQSGPGFDYEVAKVRRGEAKPAPDSLRVPRDHMSEATVAVLDRACRMGEVFGHPWVGTEHLGLALVEASAEATEIVGGSWDVLAEAVAGFYEGPFAEARLALARARLASGWRPTPLLGEVTPVSNWALRRLLLEAADSAVAVGGSRVEPAQVACRLVDPTTWSLVNQLLNR